MYTPKEVCDKLDITYETLKFYCREGLVPGVERNSAGRRSFSEENFLWLQGLMCLRKCGMSLKDMKKYMEYCIVGKDSIPERKAMLDITREELVARQREIQESIDYIDNKQKYYDDVVAGKIPYESNLQKCVK